MLAMALHYTHNFRKKALISSKIMKKRQRQTPDVVRHNDTYRGEVPTFLDWSLGGGKLEVLKLVHDFAAASSIRRSRS